MKACFSRFACATIALTFSIPAAHAQLKNFKLGISAPAITVFPAHLGDAGGFFEKQGLKVEVVTMEGGTRGIQVLLSGEIQAMHVGLAPMAPANASGADLKLVASTSNVLPFVIFSKTKSDPPIPKGAKYGISTFGSETDVAISILLPKLGMKREDIEITQVGGTAQRLAALIAGRLDLAPLLEPSISQARARGFHPVIDLSTSGDAWVFDSVVITRTWADANKDTLKRFLRGYIEGVWWGLKEPEKAKALIGQKYRITDKQVIDITYEDYRKLMPLDARPSYEGSKNVLAQLAGIGVSLKSQKVEDYVDYGPLDELAKEGFFAELESKYAMKITPTR